MPFTREELIERISTKLAILCTEIKFKNSLKMRDSNLFAEDFYSKLLNIIFGYKLKNANTQNHDEPGIDLIDKDNKLVIQVTITKTSNKIQHSIDEFISNNHNTEGYHLIMFLLCEKQKTYKVEFNTQGRLIFDKHNDIWDVETVLSHLKSYGTINTLKKVLEFLDEELIVYPNATEFRQHKQCSIPKYKPGNETIADFHGREDELEWICNNLSKNTSPIYLTGMGGIGKSRLVDKFISDHYDEFFSIHAKYQTSMMHTIAAIPFLDESNKELSAEDLCRNHLEWIENQTEKILLIIDGFDGDSFQCSFNELMNVTCESFGTNKTLINRLRSSVNIIITTRTTPMHGCVYKEIEPLALESLLLITEDIVDEYLWTEDNRQLMIEMIEAVGRHTMMVVLIASAINESYDQSFSRMKELICLKEYQSDSTDIMNTYDDIHEPLYNHMKQVFKFNGFNFVQVKILRTLSFIPVSGIHLTLFATLNVAFEIAELNKTFPILRTIAR